MTVLLCTLYMYTCTCMCIHVYMYVYVHVHVHVHVHTSGVELSELQVYWSDDITATG